MDVSRQPDSRLRRTGPEGPLLRSVLGAIQPRWRNRGRRRTRAHLGFDDEHGRESGVHRSACDCGLRVVPPASLGTLLPAWVAVEAVALTRLSQANPATIVRSDGSRVVPPVHPSECCRNSGPVCPADRFGL